MFTSFGNPFKLPQYLFGGRNNPSNLDILSVKIHEIETSPEKRARKLKHLIRLNHANHSLVYHNLQFHNHMPHILGSAYILGASTNHLDAIYERESHELETWHDSPGEISRHDWRDYLGDPRYQRAFVDFYEDELVLNGYDWRKVVSEYLFSGSEPLVNNLICGLGHPLIHLGYAYELSNPTLAIESLVIISTSHDYLHKYLDSPTYTRPSPHPTIDLLEILHRVANDDRFISLTPQSAATLESQDRPELFKDLDHEAALLEHWNSWSQKDHREQLLTIQRAAIAVLVGTTTHHHSAGKYDFFFVHLLTTSHAILILLLQLPVQHKTSVLRQWWLLALSVYVMQSRPVIDISVIENLERGDKGWEWVDEQAVSGKWALDAHFVKACRAMKQAARTWGEKDEFFIKAGVKFAMEFDGWGF
ncbi:MAG: hypothetical protein M1827_006932 [Pycnora praestabilis]|nr:MAG: hypothetical protein M1827_006932 [Pycnora praestabilis]